MLLAEGGVPSLWLVAATLVGGTLAAGSANTLNCYLDRDIDQVMHRTERRPLATGADQPARGAGLRRRARRRWPWPGCGSRSTSLPALARACRDRVLRRRLHAGCSSGAPRRTSCGAAPPAACRCSSAGRPSPARCRWTPVVLFARHLLLDAAALLAAVAALPRRLRRGRRADAARRRDAGDGRPPDRRLQLGDGRGVAGAVAGGRHDRWSTASPRWCSAPGSCARRTRLLRAGPGRHVARPAPRCGSSTARSPI